MNNFSPVHHISGATIPVLLLAVLSVAALTGCMPDSSGTMDTREQPLSLDSWQYIEVDAERAKWGDFDEPEWLRYFGVDMGDVNDDGYKDILAGRHVYLNPGAGMIGSWERVDLSINVDGILMMDVDDDHFADVIAQALPDLYWIEAENSDGTSWHAKKVGTVPPTSHINSQGFEKGNIVGDDTPEILIAGDGNIYAFEIPENPDSDTWNRTLVAPNTSDEGLGVGDIDGDGDVDIAAGRRDGDEPHIVTWWENPGNGQGDWPSFEIGRTPHSIDRVEVADMNGDGREDIVIAEERYPGPDPDANLFVFEQPSDAQRSEWNRHTVVTEYSLNNLDVADMDADGDVDLVTCEHKGPHLKLQIWENNGSGQFIEHTLDQGKESHLGTQVTDLDGDGDLDIVSIAWDNYRFLHVWRNDSVTREGFANAPGWKHLSSTKGDFPPPMPGDQQTASLVADLDNDGVNDFVITERTSAPSVVWYRRTDDGWTRYILDDTMQRIEAGSAALDIDRDGDTDVVFGGEGRSNQVWWWENPYPNFDVETPWQRHLIKDGGANKHHDQMFIDADGDGTQELVFWNQSGHSLFLAEIPENPREANEWERTPIFTYSVDGQMQQRGMYPGWKGINEHEGLAKIDIDGDGQLDIVGGGSWFKHVEGTTFEENIIDAGYTFTRSAAGQFIEGGRPEVVLLAGDGTAPMVLYEWRDGTWTGTILLEEVVDGHSISIVDFNGDGHLDIFTAEMRLGTNPDAKTRILLGDGTGHFEVVEILSGYGLHESVMADLDGDGDYDILAKPYTWEAPRLDIWLFGDE